MLTDGRTDGWTGGRTENRTPISHPATSRCDKKIRTLRNQCQCCLCHKQHKDNEVLSVGCFSALFSMLRANAGDDILFFSRIGCHFMQILSLGDNLHEMSNPIFCKK